MLSSARLLWASLIASPSPRLWESLGFTKAGLIPDAGRLKNDGGGEEYVDALVFYKSFVGEGDHVDRTASNERIQ